jgi:hypothetical protein
MRGYELHVPLDGLVTDNMGVETSGKKEVNDVED